MRRAIVARALAALVLAARGGGAQPATVTNAIGMEFVLVQPGTMVVGRFQPVCPDSTAARGRPPADPRMAWGAEDYRRCEEMVKRDARPGFTALVARPYYIGKYEVTQAEWTRVMGTDPSVFKGERRPVDNVTWDDAQAFVRRLNALDRTARYRLPTELEWEYAARAGADSEPAWPQIRASAWQGEVDKGTTHPVGGKQPNAWGLFDTLGNVWEWVEDRYNEKLFPDPAPPRTGATHVLRGGSFTSDVKNATWFTHAGGPGSGFDVGFRVVRELPPGGAAEGAAEGAPAAPERDAQRVIFDTDMGNDVDDALALAVLHALESRGESRLLAVTVTKDEPFAAPYVDLVNTFYGRPDIPIGVTRSGITPKPDFQTDVAQLRGAGGAPLYPHDLRDGRRAPDATAVLRRALAAQPDGSVVLVQVGFSTNLARLLDTPPDARSPLAGRELVARKVRVLQMMAGYFGGEAREPSPGFVEFNVGQDVASARALFERWPTPIEVSGFEVGTAVIYPAVSVERDFAYVAHHPVREGYVRFRQERFPYDRPTWDVTSVLQAVRPDRGYFGRSEPGRVTVDARGRVSFRPEPGGPHRYLTVSPEQAVRAREAMVILASEPPTRAAPPARSR